MLKKKTDILTESEQGLKKAQEQEKTLAEPLKTEEKKLDELQEGLRGTLLLCLSHTHYGR